MYNDIAVISLCSWDGFLKTPSQLKSNLYPIEIVYEVLNWSIQKRQLMIWKNSMILLQNTIQEVYPKYYPEEVVRFFSQQHCWENLERDLEEERIYILQDGECVIGAGSFEGNHITRVFVRKDYQRHGVGSLIMQRLEDVIAREYESVRLEATLPAVIMFEKRGYRTIRHEKWTVRNGAVLVYPVMEKILRR